MTYEASGIPERMPRSTWVARVARKKTMMSPASRCQVGRPERRIGKLIKSPAIPMASPANLPGKVNPSGASATMISVKGSAGVGLSLIHI